MSQGFANVRAPRAGVGIHDQSEAAVSRRMT